MVYIRNSVYENIEHLFSYQWSILYAFLSTLKWFTRFREAKSILELNALTHDSSNFSFIGQGKRHLDAISRCRLAPM